MLKLGNATDIEIRDEKRKLSRMSEVDNEGLCILPRLTTAINGCWRSLRAYFIKVPNVQHFPIGEAGKLAALER